MDQYPSFSFFASEQEVQARLNQKQISEDERMLGKCDGLMLREINGELMAVVDIDVYQYLVNALMDKVEREKK